MTKKIVIFPHTIFKNEEDLRNWLAGSLKLKHEGKYPLTSTKGLGQLEEGSIVFFHINSHIVGMAVVEEGLRPIKKEEIVNYDEFKKIMELSKMEFSNIIKFFPSSIWAFSNEEFIPREEVGKILNKDIHQNYTNIDTLNDLLKILALIKHK